MPNQLAKLLRSGQAMLQAAEFSLGKDIEGFVLVDKDGRDILDKDDIPMQVGPAPLERSEELAALVHDMALLMRSNNDSERVFTHASRGFTRGGRNVTPATISTWVRRKDWISAGLWGKEKDASFLEKFGKWHRFVSTHNERLSRLFLPDIAGAEEKKTASQLAKLPLKYHRGESYAVSHIGPSKDFYTFGQKPPGGDDAEDAPTRTGILKRTSAGETLRQKARAARARNKNDIPISKTPISKKPGKKVKKARNGMKAPARKAQQPPATAAAADLRSDGEDNNLGGGDVEDDPEAEFANNDSDRVLESSNPSADPGPASPASAGSIPVAASGGAALAGWPASQEEHQSFAQVREWINSRAVKVARKEIRASRLRSDAAGAKEVEIANGLDSDDDEYDAEWAPSRVTSVNKDYITVTRSVGGESYRVNKGRTSSLILHHVYDRQTGESQLVQIQSVCWDRTRRVWEMRFCRVYSTEQALGAADQEDDKEVLLSDGKVVTQRGRAFLRNVCADTKRLHHIGDVHITSQPVYIIGIAAWLPATALICDAKQLETRKRELKTDLVSHCGIQAMEAKRLAEDPIYVGEYFSEIRAEEHKDLDEASDSSDVVSDSEEESAGRHVLQPSRKPLRKLREKWASGQTVCFVTGLQDADDDDIPLFPDSLWKTSPKANSVSKESDSDDSADLDTPLVKRQKIERGALAGSGAPAGDVVGAVKVAKGRGSVARRQERDRVGAEDVAEERGRRGRGGGGKVPAQACNDSGVEELIALPGRGRTHGNRR